MENWNKLCYYLSEKITTDIPEIEFEPIVEKGLEILGWDEFSGDFEIRPNYQLGSSKNSLKPDFLIKSNQTGEKLFVIEIKRPKVPLNNQNQIQLSTYMRQFKLDFGILIGPQIQVFYDGELNKNENAILIENIEFKRESEKGKQFIELFSKNKFDKKNLKDFANKSFKKINEKETEKEIKSKILSKNFIDNISQVIIEKLSVEYDINLVTNVLKNINFEVSEKFNTIQNTDRQESKNYLKVMNSKIIEQQNSKDRTKYVLNNNGVSFGKSRIVLEIVKEYLKRNHTDFRSLKNIFPDKFQGSTGVINELKFVEQKYIKEHNKRHFMNDILESSDNIQFVVSNQWNLNNVQNILKLAKSEGFQIEEYK